MVTELITAVATAFGKGADLAKPYIEEHFAQDLTNEANSSISEWNNIEAIKDPIERADAEFDYVKRLFNSIGETTGNLGSGSRIVLTTDILARWIEITVKYRKDQKLLNRFQQNLLQGK